MKRLRSWWLALLILAAALAYGGFASLVWAIQADARRVGADATQDFPGDDVEALIALVESDHHSFADRNHAVWALGQIGDRRAVDVLAKFYTGRKCEHSRFLCQLELKKAIDRCNGKNWAPAWLPFFPRPIQG